jgi:D-3-phosphoglycerate dehydrogenase
MYKVIATDGFDAAGADVFKAAGDIQLDVRKGASADEVLQVIGEYDGLIVRSATKVTPAIIEAGTRLKVIGRAGVGVDNVDVPAASRRGIVVMNTPEANTISTAEHTVAMMFAVARQIGYADAAMKAGKWEKKSLKGVELYGKTLGVIGFGRIGRWVARIAKSVGMEILAYDPLVTAERIREQEATPASLDEIYARSDVITVHTPLNDNTKNLMCAATIAKMKKGVMLINCARGGIINENDLCDALDSGQVGGAALDVFGKEPSDNERLRQYRQVTLTPHIAASTGEAQSKVSVEIAQQIVRFLKDGVVANAVNMPSMDAERMRKVTPYVALGSRLGTALAQLVRGKIVALEITYEGTLEAMDVAPVTSAVISGLLAHRVDGVNFVNARLIAADCGLKITERKTASVSAYTNLLQLEAKVEGHPSSMIAGTIFGEDRQHPRIVRVDNFHVDALPEGYLLFLVHRDAPGVIGKIGTVLGDNNININRMTCDRLKPGELNVGVFSLDHDVPPDVLNKLTTIDGISEAVRVALL